MAERRAALRLSREQSSLSIDTKAGVAVAELLTAQWVISRGRHPGAEEDDNFGFTDDLDDDPRVDDGHFYDDVLQDV